MGHARYDELRDLEDVLDAIRKLPGMVERAPAIFYLRRLPFLHFHTKAGARWADAKIGSTWGDDIPIPVGATQRAKAAFLREVRKRHAATLAGANAR